MVLNSGVTVGSNSTSIPSFKVDSLLTGSVINLTNNGTIVGRGGDGGDRGMGGSGENGSNGGDAMNILYLINISNNGIIGGGGGGSGGSAGYYIDGISFVTWSKQGDVRGRVK